MIRSLRQRFNASWTEAQYQALVADLQRHAPGSIDLPLAETPCFFPRDLIASLATIGEELILQALSGGAATAAAAITPERFRGGVATEPHPTFVQVHFGLEKTPNATVSPKLVELRAFPSLYAFQPVLAEAYREAFRLPDTLDVYAGGMTSDAYRALLQQALTGPHDPREVVLLEIDPQRQKTRPDFVLTEQFWGVRAIDTSEVIREGRQLFYRRDGELTPIRRVCNRIIPDELERTGASLPFDYRDDLNVEWTGHPEWYFRISKFSIPFLRHPSVPRTWFLDAVTELPAAREDLLLKPLFSSAGGGIIFAPSDQELAAIPADKRHLYILQERVSFAPVIDTPYGATQAEIRMMYVWTDRLRAVLPLVRMGRGRMMGVDHNRGLRWVGASAGLMASHGA